MRKAPPRPHPRLLRSSVAVILGWVLVGVLACASFNKLLGPSNVHLVVVGSSNQGESWPSTAPQPEFFLPEKGPEALAPWRAPARPRDRLPCVGKLLDGQPFLFQSPERPDRKAYVCLNQKAGSTTWNLALLRAGPHTRYHNLIVSPHRAPAEPNCKEHEWDADVPRFAMVRNPYSRLLSGFLDKCARYYPSNMNEVCTQIRERIEHGEDVAATFPTFVKAAIAYDPDKINDHFRLQIKHCHIEYGIDYYLRAEQIAHWYEPFVAALDLGETVRTGWNVSTKWWHNDGSECFYHPPGLGCDGAPLSTAGAGPLAGGSWHATGSDARLDEFYTPELARAVTEWAKADLEEFGYPAWDGVDGQGYLRRISTPSSTD